jgi:hypothetical protein
MTTSNDQPMSRRAARQQGAAVPTNEPGSAPTFASPPGGDSASNSSVSSATDTASVSYSTEQRPRVRRYQPPAPPSESAGQHGVEQGNDAETFVAHEPAVASEPAVATPHAMTRRELRATLRSQRGNEPVAAHVEAPEPAPTPTPTSRHLAEPVTEQEPGSPAALIEPGQPAALDHRESAVSSATGAHWTSGFSAPVDDVLENTFSRQVGGATGSTNALVLPELPLGSLTGPVPGTGEIIITGRIDLPASMASTGAASVAHDSPDIDDMGAEESQQSVNDSAPVSAMRAVSGHYVSREVVTAPRSTSNLVTTILIVSTIVMAVAAVAIFVVAAANGLF